MKLFQLVNQKIPPPRPHEIISSSSQSKDSSPIKLFYLVPHEI